MSSCHNKRPARRTLSLFCSDCGLENLNTTLRGQHNTHRHTQDKRLSHSGRAGEGVP